MILRTPKTEAWPENVATITPRKSTQMMTGELKYQLFKALECSQDAYIFHPMVAPFKAPYFKLHSP